MGAEPEVTASGLHVSRETLGDLRRFVEILERWNPKLNLVSSSSLRDVWPRHIEDSVQLARFVRPGVERYVDLGSGSGFPGVVLSVLFRSINPGVTTVLVESDRRKTEFLRAVFRSLDLKGEVICGRIESVSSLRADLLTARALAPLKVLLGMAQAHLLDEGRALFPKGESWQIELQCAAEKWRFDHLVHESSTLDKAAVLEVWNIQSA